jgi:polar amino acid transport system substrate-binding protein
MNRFTRRDVWRSAAAIVIVGCAPRVALAQSAAGQGLLKRLQAGKKVRVGIANQPPFSWLEPDGSVSGAAPDISRAILGRLGITEIEGFVADYGQLIPGMMAGRWDFVSASLTISKARCAQVLYADPLIFDGSALFYKKGKSGPQPKSIADIIKMQVPVGTQAGGADYRTVVTAGVPLAKVVQFGSDQAIIDGIMVDRVEYALTAYSGLKTVLRQRKIDSLEIVYPVIDDPAKGSSCAFRTVDTDLHAAYQTELRAMKASGEFQAILQKYGYETTSDLMKITNDQACSTAS